MFVPDGLVPFEIMPSKVLFCTLRAELLEHLPGEST